MRSERNFIKVLGGEKTTTRKLFDTNLKKISKSCMVNMLLVFPKEKEKMGRKIFSELMAMNFQIGKEY